MKTLQKICLQGIAAIGAAIFLVLTYFSWRYTVRMYSTDEGVHLWKDTEWKNLLFLLIVLFIVGLLSRLCAKLKKGMLHGAAVMIAIGITVGLIFVVKQANAYTVGDQAQIQWGAEALFSGLFQEVGSYEYFLILPYQLRLSWLYAVIFKVTGVQSAQILQFVHAICVGITVYTGYRCTRELFDSRRMEAVYLLCILCFLPLYIYVLYIYGEPIGVMCASLGIYFYLLANKYGEHKKLITFGYWILSGLFLFLAYTVRNALIIVWFAMAIVQFCIFLRTKSWKSLFPVVLILGFIFIGERLFFLPVWQNTGIALNQGAPASLSIAMGFQDNANESRGPGSYNGFNWVTFRDSGYDKEKSSAIALENIKERFSYWAGNPGDAVRFFKEKIQNQWIEPTYNSFTMTHFMEEPAAWLNDLYFGKANEDVTGFLDRYQSTAYLALFGFFICLLRPEKKEERLYLLGLILIGGFLFSLIWESKARYVYPYMIFAMPCIAAGLVLMCEKCEKLIVKSGKYVVKRLHKAN